jgi:UDP-glucose 4-epimerase
VSDRPLALVTGAAGFLGSHLVDYLLDAMKMDVVGLDDLSGGARENVHPRATFVQGSVTDEALVKDLFARHKFRYVYHLAAYAAEGLSHFIRGFNYTNNLLGSVYLLNASVNHKVDCFVFTSSIAVYGAGQVPMLEDTVPRPEDPYGIAKLAVEQDLAAAHHMFGIDSVVFRPHNVYGERQNLGDKYRNVVGIFMKQILAGEEITIFGDGEQRRAFTYVGDIIPGIARSVMIPEARNRVFNVGSDSHHSVNQLADIVVRAMGRPASIRRVEARNEVKIAYSDHTRFQQVFKDLAQTPLEEGVRRMAEWARTAPVRKSGDFSNIEIPRNLPPVWTAAKRS